MKINLLTINSIILIVVLFIEIFIYCCNQEIYVYMYELNYL